MSLTQIMDIGNILSKVPLYKYNYIMVLEDNVVKSRNNVSSKWYLYFQFVIICSVINQIFTRLDKQDVILLVLARSIIFVYMSKVYNNRVTKYFIFISLNFYTL